MELFQMSTPIPIINKIPVAFNYPQAIVTALSLIGSSWLMSLREYRKIKAKVAYLLITHARAYANPWINTKPDELHNVANDDFHDIAATLKSFAIERLKVC